MPQNLLKYIFVIRFGFRQCCSYKSYHNGIVHFLSSKQTYFFKKVCNKLVLCVFYMNVHVCHCTKYKASVHSREQVCHNLKIVWSLTLWLSACVHIFNVNFLYLMLKTHVLLYCLKWSAFGIFLLQMWKKWEAYRLKLSMAL